MIKNLVCLANSRKPGDRCIAGREFLAGAPANGFAQLVIERMRRSQSLN